MTYGIAQKVEDSLPRDWIVSRVPFFYGWVMLPIVLMIQVATGPGQTYGVSVFNPYIRRALNLSHSEISGAYMLGTFLASLPMIYVGALMDRYGPRRILVGVVLIDSGAFAVLQIPYSALERKHEDLISMAAAKGIGNVIRGGVAKGEPGKSGKVGRVSWDPFEQAKLDELLDSGESRTSFMLRFTISHPGMHTTIVGTLNPDHLRQNVDAVERGPLPDDVYTEAKKRLTEVGQVPAAS